MNRKQRRIAQSQSKLQPVSVQAYYNQGVTLQELGRFEEALASYDKAIALKPDYIEACANRGIALQKLHRYEEALADGDRVIALDPYNAYAHHNQGVILQELERYEEALASYDKAIALKPDFIETYVNRGVALQKMHRFEEALANGDRVIALNPRNAYAHHNQGVILQELGRYEEALASCDTAIALNPDYAEAYNNRGNILKDMKRYEEAIASFEQARTLKPDIPYVSGILFFLQMSICKWQGIEQRLENLAKGIETGKPSLSPFEAAVTQLSLVQQKRCAEIYVRDKFPPRPALWNGERYMHDKIRLGYFSADFHNHATAYLIAELLELHDRSRFEVTGFSFGPPSAGTMRPRLEKAFDRFMDVRTHSDMEIAALARNMEIDIAIDLKGFTQHSRTGIFALRPAPVQVNYLGYPGTMGASYMDYIIADPMLIPEAHRPYYTEKIAYLPHSYQANDSTRKISDKAYTRKEAGLPETGFVFCCFNNNYKITSDMFDIWMRLLHKVEGSVLWLLADNLAAMRNLQSEAVARGIAQNRLVFAERMDLAEHLARHRLADLFLDTLPYNAHTTASDALWAGLPVLTCLGEAFAGRVAASLLNAIGLPELVTHSPAEYEALALQLATHSDKLPLIRHKLAHNKTMQPLFNTPLFTRHIEEAYSGMINALG